MKPTPAGQRYYKHCIEAIGQIAKANADVRAFAARVTGDLRIGLIPTLTRAALAPALEKFVAQYPDVRLHIVEGYSGTLTDMVQNGELDFAGVPAATAAPKALSSPHLARMLTLYLKAANLNLNAHYPAVNALALLKVQLALAKLAPDEWQAGSEDDTKAEAALKVRESLATRLTSSLCLALEMDELMGRRFQT